MLEEERSAMLAIAEDQKALLSTTRIHKDEVLAELEVAHKRIAD